MSLLNATNDLHWLQDIERSYAFQIEAIIHMRSVVGVRSNGQNYIVKNLTGSIYPRRIHAIAKGLEQMYRNGAPVCPILRNQDGRFFTRSGGRLYIVQPWISGRHVDFTVESELSDAVEAIARMHTRPVLLPKEWADELEVPSLGEKYSLRLNRCQKLIQNDKHVWKNILDFDTWNQMEQQAIQSIRSIQKKLHLNKRSTATVSFCHRDLAPHNLLFRSPSKVTLIDFDLSGFDFSMHDLYQVTNHTMYLHGWDESYIKAILETYDREAGITHADSRLFYDLMQFPSLITREVYDQSRRIKASKGKINKDKIITRIRWALEIEQAKQEWLNTDGKHIWK
jgi:CotS family spore coat protein